MNVNISFHPKDHMAFLNFSVEDFKSDLQLKECLAIVAIICGDFYLDPELEIEDIEQFVEAAKEKQKTQLVFELSEEGLELELK